jgi:cell filamentation protein
MKKHGDRYDVSGLVEAQFEPGSGRRVLKNRLGINSRRKMDNAEAAALRTVMDRLVRKYDEGHRFTAVDICGIHRMWLSGIYDWAGEYRMVNISKDGFPFAAAARVPSLMAKFDREVLARCTPCRFANRKDVVGALAEVHVELVLIHPFREGNGRIARALSILMALQAGLPLLDFSPIAGRGKNGYVAAVQAGLDRNYERMGEIFSAIIDRSLAAS